MSACTSGTRANAPSRSRASRDDAGRRSPHHDGQDEGSSKFTFKLGTDRILVRPSWPLGERDDQRDLRRHEHGNRHAQAGQGPSYYRRNPTRSGWPRWPIPSTSRSPGCKRPLRAGSPDRSARQRRVDDGLRFAQGGPANGPSPRNSRRRSCIYLRRTAPAANHPLSATTLIPPIGAPYRGFREHAFNRLAGHFVIRTCCGDRDIASFRLLLGRRRASILSAAISPKSR